jgi:hypothetical protein
MIRLILTIFLAGSLLAQSQRLLGTVVSVDGAKGELIMKDDKGEAYILSVPPDVVVKQVSPGERDLTKAKDVAFTGLAAGDRILATGAVEGKTMDAQRLVVMSSRDIQARNSAEQQEWARRGVTGLVTGVDKDKKEIKLQVRSLTGVQDVTLKTSDKTSFKRYAPDSIKFADAKDAALADIRKGDQVRALGDKSADGAEVAVERVVAGSFKTVGGVIASVDEAAGEIKMKDYQSGKTLTIRTKADSQLKRMPNFGAMMGGGMPGGMRPPGAGGPGAGGPPGGGAPGGSGRGPGGPGMGGGPPGMGGGRMPDLAQMLERMPGIKFAELKVGETIVVSSTVGSKADEYTAIT